MASPNYNEELELALQVVHRASVVTKKVMRGIESVDKNDSSPVTMADFAAQALIICALHQRFPHDRFVAEESSDMLRENQALLESVWKLVAVAQSSVTGFSDNLSVPQTKEEMMDIIDLGSSKAGTPSAGRVWILDPVDGTATFMIAQQYAVCLSLTVDGKQQVGVLGCPNLKPGERRVEEELTDLEGYGVVLSATLGGGTHIASMTESGLGEHKQVLRTREAIEKSDIKFVDSVKSSHADLAAHRKVFDMLEMKNKHLNLWSMQMKYIALALGACDAMIRIPQNRGIRPYVWDHAGGQLLFTESGGIVTDLDGKAFDFAKGRKFGENWGWVVAEAGSYDTVFATAQEVLKARDEPADK